MQNSFQGCQWKNVDLEIPGNAPNSGVQGKSFAKVSYEVICKVEIEAQNPIFVRIPVEIGAAISGQKKKNTSSQLVGIMNHDDNKSNTSHMKNNNSRSTNQMSVIPAIVPNERILAERMGNHISGDYKHLTREIVIDDSNKVALKTHALELQEGQVKLNPLFNITDVENMNNQLSSPSVEKMLIDDSMDFSETEENKAGATLFDAKLLSPFDIKTGMNAGDILSHKSALVDNEVRQQIIHDYEIVQHPGRRTSRRSQRVYENDSHLSYQHR